MPETLRNQQVRPIQTGTIGSNPRVKLHRLVRIASAARLLGLFAALLGLTGAGALAADGAVKILAFGDSLTHGYGLAAGQTFPEQLQGALTARGHAVQVINAGNSGDTTAAGLARLDWALADEPDLVIVEFGANDGLRGIDPADTYRNLDAILTRLRADGLSVLLTGMLAPRNMGPEYVAAFDAVFPRLADEQGVAFYPFFLDGVAADPALNQPDGIHPNAAGVARIVEGITPYVEPLVEAIAQERTSADG